MQAPLISARFQQGGHKVGEKNSLSFSGFSRAINLLFHRLSQQKVNAIMIFIKGHDPVYPVNSCFIQIFEWWTKNTLFVKIFPSGCTEFTEFSENSPSFPRSEKFLSTPGFPGLWPACPKQCANVLSQTVRHSDCCETEWLYFTASQFHTKLRNAVVPKCRDTGTVFHCVPLHVKQSNPRKYV